MQRIKGELYFSFFMGRLLGDHLRETLSQIKKERRELKDALSRSEVMLEEYKLQLGLLREKGLEAMR
jgi:hypothetical protein